MIYDVSGNRIKKYPSLAGDGVTDDTLALQALVNSEKEIRLAGGLTIKITAPITIDISKIKLFDGGNSEFVISGDIVGFNIVGSLETGMSALPTTLDDDIIHGESSFIFQNCKIRNAAKTAGTGLKISGCFQSVIRNNYLCDLNIGIAIEGVNRNLSINNNNIYKITSYGIHFKTGLNLHQVNTNSNFITYCKYCVFVDNVDNLINWQCVGNNLEVYNYANASDDSYRCIKMVANDAGVNDSDKSVLTECVITGNDIQGHTDNSITVEIVGGAHRFFNHFNISGNHIGNGADYSIYLEHCKCVSISANSCVSGNGPDYMIKVKDSRAITITGNAIRSTGGIVVGEGTITGIVVTGNIGENCSGRTVSLSAGTTGSCVTNNVFDGVVQQ